MTPKEVHDATWIPHPIPEGEQREIMAPWASDPTRGILRVLSCVEIDGEVYVIARDKKDQIRETWKVLK